MTNYERGRRFEYKIKKMLEKAGFVVFRTAGSHGEVDLIAINDTETFLLQLKYGKPITKADRKKFFIFQNKFSNLYNDRFCLMIHQLPRKKPTAYSIGEKDYNLIIKNWILGGL